MNIMKKFYCRTYQTLLKLILPLMPFREPKLLSKTEDITTILKEKNINRVLLVTDCGIKNLGLTNKLEKNLEENNIHCSIYDKTVANPTILNVEEALKLYNENKCSGIISFGGGSPMDCAKAVGARVARPNKTVSQMKGLLKVRKKLPLLIAVPTTAGTGSETTIAAVITDSVSKHKSSINDFCLIPEYAVLDENLTLGLPKHITSTTGMDALTHAIEAYIGKSTTKHTRECSLQATKLILKNITKAYNNGNDAVARKNMLDASYLAGVAFTKSYVGYVHAIAHTLGGQYGIAHGFANSVILPYVLKEYGKSATNKLNQIALYCGIANKNDTKEKGASKLIKKIEALNKYMNIPTKISGIKEEDIDMLVTYADKEANPLYPVPKLMDKKQLAKIFYLIKE